MKLPSMSLLHGFKAKHEHVTKYLIIRLPDFNGLKLVPKAIILALIIAALPSFGLAIRELPEIKAAFGMANQQPFPLYFNDLSKEGHLKFGDKVLVITRDNGAYTYKSHIFGNKDEIDYVSDTNLQQRSSFPNESFDFVFTHDLSKFREFIDKVLKIGGIVTYEYTGEEKLKTTHIPSNYKVIYFRRIQSTSVVTLKKTNTNTNTYTNTNTKFPKRKLLSITSAEEKKEMLEKLEDVLLEPPRTAKHRAYLKRTKYLPDLLGDSLDSYPRRVFIDVGPPEKASDAGDLGWFGKHYPTRNKDFELYKIDTVTEGISSNEVVQVGMSDWLRKNVREEEYVVMKAEAEVVEEMARNRALDLVDELFLECKYQGVKGQNKKSTRAYWECLALYGRLRDEGVAVHQWWG